LSKHGCFIIREKLIRAAAYLRGSSLGPVVIRSIAASSLVQMGAILAALVGSIQLARGLGVKGYGEYGIAMAVITLAGIPAELGIPKLVLRETAAAAALKDWATFFGVLRWADRTCWRVSAILAFGITVGSMLILGAQKSTVVTAILLGVPIIPFLAMAKIRGAALQGLQFLVLGQIPQTLLRPVLLSIMLFILYLARRFPSASGAMALNSATALTALIINHIWLRRKKSPENAPVVPAQGRRWLKSSFPMALSDGMLQLQAQLSILAVGLLASAEDVGLFRIAVSIVTFMVAPVVLLNVATLPVYSRLFVQRDMTRFQRLCTRSTQLQFTAILLISLPLLVDGRAILGFIFGEAYRGAFAPMAVSFGGFLFSAACGPNSELLNMTGHERRVTRAMAIGLITNLVTMPLLVRLFGVAGAALSLSIGTIAWNLVASRDAFRLLHVNTTLAPIAVHRGEC
jgi:O-antigen/teichoic acid export membrane protein